MNRTLICLLCLVPAVALGAPDVRVRTALLGADNAVVGGTVTLQVDVLVDTWFSAAPELPTLELDGAVVSPPNGEAVHLTEKQDGETLFGLRYSYQLTLQSAKAYDIPALPIGVNAGQASQPLTVSTSTQHFTATQPGGAQQGEVLLVAQDVEVTQTITASHDPLRVGDSIRREVRVRAVGAQAMLMPAPTFAEIKGLARTVQPPAVHPLSDGRGGVIGGAREDTVVYQVTTQGRFPLPVIEIKWWGTDDRQVHVATAAQAIVEAHETGGYQAPFSVAEDLRALRHNAQVKIARHGPGIVGALMLAAVCCYFGWPRARRLYRQWQGIRALRHHRWLQSSEYAWQLARTQLAAAPPRLDGLYVWVRRRWGQVELLGFSRRLAPSLTTPLQRVLETAYGRSNPSPTPFATLVPLLDALSAASRSRRPGRLKKHGLKPLNPTLQDDVFDERECAATDR